MHLPPVNAELIFTPHLHTHMHTHTRHRQVHTHTHTHTHTCRPWVAYEEGRGEGGWVAYKEGRGEREPIPT